MAEVEQAEARAGSDSVIGSYYVKVMKRALAGAPRRDRAFSHAPTSERVRRQGSEAFTQARRPNASHRGADDEFVAKETARLRKLIDESTLAEAKRAEFARRVNALASFQSSDAPASG